MQEIQEHIKVWAAGFFDGEGAVGVRHKMRGRRSSTIWVAVSQVDPQPLKVLQSHWGGTIRVKNPRRANSRSICEWHLWSKKAKKFLCDIHRYTQRDIVKLKLDLAIQFQEETSLHGKGKYASAAYSNRLERLQLALKELNKRGLEGELYTHKQPPTPIAIDPQLSLMWNNLDNLAELRSSAEN